MTEPSEAPKSWGEALEDQVWRRWRLLLVGVVLLFALNSIAGFVVGGLGFVAFAHRLAGRALKAGRLAQQVREIVIDPPKE